MLNFYKIIASVLFILGIVLVLIYWPRQRTEVNISSSVFNIRSIDTMKYSRDLASEKLNDLSFNMEIEEQVRQIKGTGANYIAIATPYDNEFSPFLNRWARAARKNHLHIWFRGNFSSWEGWFGREKRMSFDEHINRSIEFIKNNPDLFEDGDAFTACPECENGAAGDPRQTGRVVEYRQFLIKETQQTTQAFKKINKKVTTNWLSMNKDVADLVMDEQTVKETGGVITIDHYVKDPQQLAADIKKMSTEKNAQIFLGEFGAPIPDLNGEISDEQQANWLNLALESLSKTDNLVGINYWVNKGSSTRLWKDSGQETDAVKILSNYFKASTSR